MVNLEDIQRSFEELEANIARLESEGVLELGTVSENVGAMKLYVEDLWSEFEDSAPRSDEELPQGVIPLLDAFIADSEVGSFGDLKTSYRAARLGLLSKLATIAGVSDRKADGLDQANGSPLVR
jgi:hypothetical protein